jgi:hypothetical protein
MPDRTREILEDLEAVRENLLALSDEIWLSIDPITTLRGWKRGFGSSAPITRRWRRSMHLLPISRP